MRGVKTTEIPTQIILQGEKKAMTTGWPKLSHRPSDAIGCLGTANQTNGRIEKGLQLGRLQADHLHPASCTKTRFKGRNHGLRRDQVRKERKRRRSASGH